MKAHEGSDLVGVTMFPSPRTRSILGPRSWIAGIYQLPREFLPICTRLCELIEIKSYDNAYALKQIEEGHNLLLSRKPATNALARGYSKSGRTLPRLITLGGDHTITLPLLRSINR